MVELEVVDRGPFTRGRILDVSRRAAEELGFVRQGHTRIRIEVLEYGDG
jgi:rare lipoprotein A